MVVYTLEQRWEILRQIDLQKMPILAKKKKKSFFQVKLILILAKLSSLKHRKHSRIHWKADAHKTSHCLVRSLVQRHNWAIFLPKLTRRGRPLQSMAIVIVPFWMNFCSQKLKRSILTIFGFNRTALRATQPRLHLMFYALFLKIALLSRIADVVWPPRSCDLTPLEYYFIYLSVTPKSQKQLTLSRTIFMKPLMKYSWTQSIMCLQIGPIV